MIHIAGVGAERPQGACNFQQDLPPSYDTFVYINLWALDGKASYMLARTDAVARAPPGSSIASLVNCPIVFSQAVSAALMRGFRASLFLLVGLDTCIPQTRPPEEGLGMPSPCPPPPPPRCAPLM